MSRVPLKAFFLFRKDKSPRITLDLLSVRPPMQWLRRKQILLFTFKYSSSKYSFTNNKGYSLKTRENTQ